MDLLAVLSHPQVTTQDDDNGGFIMPVAMHRRACGHSHTDGVEATGVAVNRADLAEQVVHVCGEGVETEAIYMGHRRKAIISEREMHALRSG
jgi:hypothetical protein